LIFKLISFLFISINTLTAQTDRIDNLYEAYAGPINIHYKKYVSLTSKDSLFSLEVYLNYGSIEKSFEIVIRDSSKLNRFKNDLINIYNLILKNDNSTYTWRREPLYFIFLSESKESIYFKNLLKNEIYCELTKNNLATLIENINVINFGDIQIKRWQNIDQIIDSN
jgi:hypothetical protein